MLLKQLIDAESLEKERYRDMRVYRIDADEDLLELQASSKLNAEWPYLCHLLDLGRERASLWLEAHGNALRDPSSVNYDWLLDESIKSSGALGDKPS